MVLKKYGYVDNHRATIGTQYNKIRDGKMTSHKHQMLLTRLAKHSGTRGQKNQANAILAFISFISNCQLRPAVIPFQADFQPSREVGKSPLNYRAKIRISPTR